MSDYLVEISGVQCSVDLYGWFSFQKSINIRLISFTHVSLFVYLRPVARLKKDGILESAIVSCNVFIFFIFHSFYFLAEISGFEPELSDRQSDVLPGYTIFPFLF